MPVLRALLQRCSALHMQDGESSSSESVYDAEDEEEMTRPLWRRTYFRRLVLPFIASTAMFLAATLVYIFAPHSVATNTTLQALELPAAWSVDQLS